MDTPTNGPFELEVLMTETLPETASDPETAESETGGLTVDKSFRGRVECSAPFNLGDSEGVWIGLQSDPSSICPVLHKKFVTRLGVLQDEGWLIVLSTKTLYAYRLESLVTPPSESFQDHPATLPEMLSKVGEVEFFRIGRVKGRSYIICMKEGTDSIFTVWKPASTSAKEKKFLSWLKKKSAPFAVSRDFYMLYHTYDVEFINKSIAVLCDRGFEIMKINKLKSTTVPDCDHLHLEELSKRIKGSKPLGLCRYGENASLLCYAPGATSIPQCVHPQVVFQLRLKDPGNEESSADDKKL